MSPSLAAKLAGQPPAWPLKIACIASCWRSSARASRRKPMFAFVSSSQMFPSNQATAAKLSPSRLTSPNLPSLMCQTRTPSQSPSVGGWANVHGHGIDALADIEPITGQMPAWNLGHSAHLRWRSNTRQKRSSHRPRRRVKQSCRPIPARLHTDNPPECRDSSKTPVFRYRLRPTTGLDSRSNR